MAAFTVLALLIQLVLAQLTLAFAVLFVVVGRVTRWRLSWLLAPAAVGLVWTLAAGPGRVLDGFAAGPAQILGYFGHGDLLGGRGHPFAGFTGPGSWLPRQLPLALLTGAAEAATIGWFACCRAGQRVPPTRPGAVAALRGALAARLIRTGAVLTRNGCALGVVRATGAVAELRWAEISGGAVVSGPVDVEVTVTCLQLAHAALRRRKPLIVIDSGSEAAVGRAVAAACAATGTPLRQCGCVSASAGPGAGDTDVDRIVADLGRVVGERSAVLLSAGSPRLADLACDAVVAVAAELRRIGVDGDALVWVPAGESLPGPALAALIRAGGAVGLPVVVGVTSPAALAELAESAGTVLTFSPRPPSRRSWQFSLVVEAPRHRRLELAQLIPARLPGGGP